MGAKSELTDAFPMQYKAAGGKYFDELEREHYFHRPRKWRIDIVHVKAKVAIELEGGVYSNGRHVRPSGYLKDIEKYNQLSLDGWALLRFARDKVIDNPTHMAEFIDKLIELRLPETDAKEGADITLAEPITVAAVEPEVTAVDVATTEPAAQPDIKLLPAHIPHPYKDATAVFVRGYGQQVYEVKATGWLSGKPTVTVAIGKGIRTKSFDIETKEWKGTDNDILWTVFADRVSIESPFVRKTETEGKAA